MNSPLDDVTTDEWQDARRAIASLIGKSEKAQQKVAPGTWQHTMLEENLTALRIAWALMEQRAGATGTFGAGNLPDALRAFASMTSKTEKAQARFSPGTSQHTLLRNRLKALRTAEALTRAQLTSAMPNEAMQRTPT